MAHTHEGKTATFIHNGDFSGNVQIVAKNEEGQEVTVIVDSNDIFELVADHIRSEIVGQVESMDAIKLLKGIFGGLS